MGKLEDYYTGLYKKRAEEKVVRDTELFNLRIDAIKVIISQIIKSLECEYPPECAWLVFDEDYDYAVVCWEILHRDDGASYRILPDGRIVYSYCGNFKRFVSLDHIEDVRGCTFETLKDVESVVDGFRNPALSQFHYFNVDFPPEGFERI